ncbi:MAG TPA: PQQ-binding-like beta-propeller repeat protein [Phycisphaerales bacterium]|nr:PQQ-binding-like beta-propeller repeat protein [Phycisphaerales bacterium]
MRPIARPIALALLMVLTAGVATTPALAQRGRSVFPDEGVGTRDALIRVSELSQAGNMPEALRVLQKTLETEGGQVVQSLDQPDLFVPVRAHIHSLLIASPDLLNRYRLEQEPAARQLLEQNRLTELEESRMLTPSGFEAVLRLAQVELEAARFESARLMLSQLEQHPDRADKARGADAARLAGMIASYLPREDVRAWAARWSKDAGLNGEAMLPPAKIPTEAAARGVSPLVTQIAPKFDNVPARPLQSVGLDLERLEVERSPDAPAYLNRVGASPWIIPTLKAGVVYVNDGRRISAWDAATLGELWQVNTGPASISPRAVEEDLGLFIQPGATQKEDAATVCVSNGIAVGVTGIAEGRGRRGDRRMHAIDSATGRTLWSIDPATLSEKLAGGAVYGPPVIEADTIVVAMRSTGVVRRDTRLHLVGVNLYTGGLKWVRLVGTVQSPGFMGRTAGRPDGAMLHNGVVYRCDEIGVMFAYEAASGRPVWLRSMPPNSFTSMLQFGGGRESAPPQEMHIPVVDGDALMAVEFPKGRVVRVGLNDGKLLAQREGSTLGDPRYLVKVGEHVAAVNGSRIAFIKGADLESGKAQLVSPNARDSVVGRVCAAGPYALVPMETGAALVDPNNLRKEMTAAFECSGNLLVVGDEQGTHLVSADATRLHTFLSWEEAETILTQRVAAQPNQPQPLLTYVELAARTGRAERVPELADRALTVLDARAGDGESARQRTRLYSMLLEMVRASRGAWTNPGQVVAVGAAQPINDAALLAQLMDRLERTAEAPQQQVAMLLEKAWLAEKQSDNAAAVEAYQRILTDTGLVAVELDSGSRLHNQQRATSFSNARTEATDRLVALVKRVGPAPYAAFDEEAARLLAEADASNPERLAELARAYPVAAVAPEAWNRASAAYAAANMQQQSKLAAGSGLAAAELGAAIGRQSTGEMLGRLTGSLLARSTGPADIEPAFRLMLRLDRDMKDLAIDWNGTTAAPAQIAAELRARLATRSGRPVIGQNLSRTVQVIETWVPLEPIVRHAPGVSGDCVVMDDENGKSVSMWAVAAEDGKLRQLWSKPYSMRPIVVRVTPDSTLLFWPSQSGGAIESISTIDGKPQWRTKEFAAFFDGGANGADDRVNTPLDGPVRPNDLVVTADGSTLVLVQRRGRAGAFDLTNGNPLWTSTLGLSRVYEIEQAGDHVVIGGTVGSKSGRTSVAGVIALDKRTGKEVSRLGPDQLGDHARWMRAVGADVVLATANGLLRFTPQSGKVAWFTSGAPGANSFAGWVVGDALFVLDGDVNLWHVSLKDGAHAGRPLDSRGRIVFPVSGTVMGKTLAVASTNGLLVFNDKGELVGADALDGQGSLQTPVATESMFVAVENNQREPASGTGIVSRVFMFAHPTGKLLNTERVRLYENPHATMVIDGKLLLSEGPVTLVLDAPPK